MYDEGEFGAHTAAVARLLTVTRVDPIALFAYGEEYFPHTEDLPHHGMAAYFKMMGMLMGLSTAQRELALDAEAFCNSDSESLIIDAHALRQRFVWERSPELLEPFDEWEDGFLLIDSVIANAITRQDICTRRPYALDYLFACIRAILSVLMVCCEDQQTPHWHSPTCCCRACLDRIAFPFRVHRFAYRRNTIRNH
jgi:hypothetical protein